VAGKPRVAVRGLSYGLEAGDVFGFMGINGAGKTTTLQMLSGDVMPQRHSQVRGVRILLCSHSVFLYSARTATRAAALSVATPPHHKQTSLVPPCHHRHRIHQLVLTLF
jgi:ABC-type multidrug transport system ATPase subunit